MPWASALSFRAHASAWLAVCSWLESRAPSASAMAGKNESAEATNGCSLLAICATVACSMWPTAVANDIAVILSRPLTIDERVRKTTSVVPFRSASVVSSPGYSTSAASTGATSTAIWAST